MWVRDNRSLPRVGGSGLSLLLAEGAEWAPDSPFLPHFLISEEKLHIHPGYSLRIVLIFKSWQHIPVSVTAADTPAGEGVCGGRSSERPGSRRQQGWPLGWVTCILTQRTALRGPTLGLGSGTFQNPHRRPGPASVQTVLQGGRPEPHCGRGGRGASASKRGRWAPREEMSSVGRGLRPREPGGEPTVGSCVCV